MKKERIFFISGLSILVVLAIGYFIKIDVESGANFLVKDSLLGIIMFHNAFVLGFYVLVAIGLILLSKKIIKII